VGVTFEVTMREFVTFHVKLAKGGGVCLLVDGDGYCDVYGPVPVLCFNNLSTEVAYNISTELTQEGLDELMGPPCDMGHVFSRYPVTRCMRCNKMFGTVYCDGEAFTYWDGVDQGSEPRRRQPLL
jgi:hypothetical protein